MTSPEDQEETKRGAFRTPDVLVPAAAWGAAGAATGFAITSGATTDQRIAAAAVGLVLAAGTGGTIAEGVRDYRKTSRALETAKQDLSPDEVAILADQMGGRRQRRVAAAVNDPDVLGGVFGAVVTNAGRFAADGYASKATLPKGERQQLTTRVVEANPGVTPKQARRAVRALGPHAGVGVDAWTSGLIQA